MVDDNAPQYELATPPASCMVEALRSIGYSLQTALADLVDNSITAQAGHIWLHFHWDGADSLISLRDDGHGMDAAELLRAMRPGSRNPRDEREAGDLGRFGLGLKTASFSQCRRLTVATKKHVEIEARCWDLDHVAETDAWQLLKDVSPAARNLMQQLDDLDHGTLVIWEKMDRVVGDVRKEDQRSQNAFYRKINRVQSHLEMVFHRFLADSTSSRVAMFINDNKLTAWDPFLTEVSEANPTQTIKAGARFVTVKGYLLPHWDRLEDKERAGGPEGWNAQQGFYLYRGKRLLVAGGWLGLGEPRRWPLEDQYKLARLQIDIETTMDHEWQIDVKKATAKVPEAMRDQLTRTADRLRVDARRVFAFRGKYAARTKTEEEVPLWQCREGNRGNRYTINRAHPLVSSIMQNSPQLDGLLKLIEHMVPVEQIWLDVTEDAEKETTPEPRASAAQVREVLIPIYQNFLSQGMDPQSAKNKLLGIEPFGAYPELVAALE